MYRTIALTTALTVFATLPANPAAAANLAQLLMEEHYSEAGYEVDLYVTRGADGGLLSEATIVDPASGEVVTAVDVWTDGTTVWGRGARRRTGQRLDAESRRDHRGSPATARADLLHSRDGHHLPRRARRVGCEQLLRQGFLRR